MLSRRYLKLRTVQAAFRILEKESTNEEDGERRVVTLFFPPERIALEMASRGEARTAWKRLTARGLRQEASQD